MYKTWYYDMNENVFVNSTAAVQFLNVMLLFS